MRFPVLRASSQFSLPMFRDQAVYVPSESILTAQVENMFRVNILNTLTVCLLSQNGHIRLKNLAKFCARFLTLTYPVYFAS